MDGIQLNAQKRSISGRKVKQLRKQGFLPANIYGKKIASRAVQVAIKEFTPVFAKAGGSGLVELTLGEKKLPVLIHNVQHHPVTDAPLHADFFQVDLKEKITAKIPVVFVGEAKAVKDKVGVILTILSELEVEALPVDLPEKIEVDITHLAAIDETIKVMNLKVNEKVQIITDSNLDIAKVAPLVSKEAEKMVEEEKAAAAAAAAATSEAGTTEAPSGGKEAVSPQTPTTSPGKPNQAEPSPSKS